MLPQTEMGFTDVVNETSACQGSDDMRSGTWGDAYAMQS